MIREALKEALLDLKSQLRGRKASKYIIEIEEAHEDAKANRKSDSEDEDDKDKREPKRSGASKASETVSDGMDSLRKEMKMFMSKPKSNVSARNVMPLPMSQSTPKATAPKESKAKGSSK